MVNKINQVLDMYDSQQAIYRDRPCHTEESIEEFTEGIRKTLPQIPNPFENCRNIIHKDYPLQNMRYAYPKDMSGHMVYELKKCKMIQDNDAKTDLTELVEEYSLLRLMASRFRCMANNSRVGASQDYFLNQVVEAEIVLSAFEKQTFRRSYKEQFE